MDEQRLERALRQGPPFVTGYAPSSLALDERPVVLGRMTAGRLVLVIAATALLLAGMLAGLVAVARLDHHVRPRLERVAGLRPLRLGAARPRRVGRARHLPRPGG